MKRENLTWQELWPLIGDGQCFDYQGMHGARPFKYIDGALHLWSADFKRWEPDCSSFPAQILLKLVEDPSKPKEWILIEETKFKAKVLFNQFPELKSQGLCVDLLVSMFADFREDLISEIEERKS